MGNLSPYVAQESATVQAIYDLHKAKNDAPPRGYLGGSVLGEECERFLWFHFRGAVAEDVSGRVYRLFETGHLHEPRLIEELRAIGCTVHDLDPETGRQFRASALGGHLAGGLDAVIEGVLEAPKTPHLGEFKTHNQKSFDALKSKGGVKGSKPRHYAQMQVYMGLFGLKRGLYLAVNKNTDELYAERVEFDRQAFEALMEKAKRVIASSAPPARIADRQDDWRCRFCDAYTLCWGVDHDGVEPPVAVPLPARTCKTCCHATPVTEGEGKVWFCERYQAEIDPIEAGRECPTHLLLPGLIPWADPTDATPESIEMTNRDGTVWGMGEGAEAWSTGLLMSERGPRDGTRSPIPEEIQGEPATLLGAYPWEDSERLWDGPLRELAGAVQEHLGVTAEALNGMEPSRQQDDDVVNAAEYRIPLVGDFLVVCYKPDDRGAIWRGKE